MPPATVSSFQLSPTGLQALALHPCVINKHIKYQDPRSLNVSAPAQKRARCHIYTVKYEQQSNERMGSFTPKCNAHFDFQKDIYDKEPLMPFKKHSKYRWLWICMRTMRAAEHDANTHHFHGTAAPRREKGTTWAGGVQLFSFCLFSQHF